MTDKKIRLAQLKVGDLYDEFQKKIVDLINSGIITPDMLDFDFDRVYEEVEVEYNVIFDGKDTKIRKKLYVDFNISIREDF